MLALLMGLGLSIWTCIVFLALQVALAAAQEETASVTSQAVEYQARSSALEHRMQQQERPARSSKIQLGRDQQLRLGDHETDADIGVLADQVKTQRNEIDALQAALTASHAKRAEEAEHAAQLTEALQAANRQVRAMAHWHFLWLVL